MCFGLISWAFNTHAFPTSFHFEVLGVSVFLSHKAGFSLLVLDSVHIGLDFTLFSNFGTYVDLRPQEHIA